MNQTTTITPQKIEVETNAIVAATNAMQKQFCELVEEFDENFEAKLRHWRLVFSLPAQTRYAGLCAVSEKLIYISTTTVARCVVEKDEDYLRGLVIHEFAHAWLWAYQRRDYLHTFHFHACVSLLLAKFGLPPDKRLYNLCDAEKDEYAFVPKLFFEQCAQRAKKMNSIKYEEENGHSTLLKETNDLAWGFKTAPETIAALREKFEKIDQDFKNKLELKLSQAKKNLLFFECFAYAMLFSTLGLLTLRFV